LRPPRDAIAGIGHLTIETSNAIVDQHYSHQHPGFVAGDYTVLSVSDDGCGIERDKITNVFDPFFTTKEHGKGTGLGLATVYGIVRQNGGFINVYSEPGHGATFRIYLPRAHGMAHVEEVKTIHPEGGTETILVVEDEQASLHLLQRYLNSLGYHVLTASNPIHALGMGEEKLDLLITDVVMPNMNGRQLAQQLQARIPGLRCLFMSGYTANVIAHRGVLDHGVNFIQKPYGLNELAIKIRKILDTD
jgi:CheY-like chemotaxis protein